jgi:hypothetical protein
MAPKIMNMAIILVALLRMTNALLLLKMLVSEHILPQNVWKKTRL